MTTKNNSINPQNGPKLPELFEQSDWEWIASNFVLQFKHELPVQLEDLSHDEVESDNALNLESYLYKLILIGFRDKHISDSLARKILELCQGIRRFSGKLANYAMERRYPLTDLKDAYKTIINSNYRLNISTDRCFEGKWVIIIYPKGSKDTYYPPKTSKEA